MGGSGRRSAAELLDLPSALLCSMLFCRCCCCCCTVTVVAVARGRRTFDSEQIIIRIPCLPIESKRNG